MNLQRVEKFGNTKCICGAEGATKNLGAEPPQFGSKGEEQPTILLVGML